MRLNLSLYIHTSKTAYIVENDNSKEISPIILSESIFEHIKLVQLSSHHQSTHHHA